MNFTGYANQEQPTITEVVEALREVGLLGTAERVSLLPLPAADAMTVLWEAWRLVTRRMRLAKLRFRAPEDSLALERASLLVGQAYAQALRETYGLD